MVLGVQVQRELNERPLQPRSPAGVEQETAAGQLGASREIDQLEVFTNFHVGLRLETEI